jgi:signal transduction histidine kinase
MIGFFYTPCETNRQKMNNFSQDCFNKVLKNTSDHIFWKNKELKYIGCNEKFAKEVGLSSPDEIVGLTDHDLPWKDHLTKIYLAEDEYVLTTKRSILNKEVPFTNYRKEDKVILLNKEPLWDGEQVNGVIGIFIDITEQKKRKAAEKREAEAKIAAAEAKAQAAEAEAAKERDIRESLMTLSSAMVHDLNNHIAIMRMSGQFMDEMVPDVIQDYQLALAHGLMPKPGHRPNQLAHLQEQGDLLKGQARGLQDYVANNLATLRKAILDELSASDLRPLEIGKVIQHFLYDFPFDGEMTDWVERNLGSNFTFQGNEMLCYRILGNLTHNAVYQIKKNNNQGHISITTQEGEEANYLIFKDNAGGATQKVIAQMFDLKFSTKDEEGNGVGLAFCKKVMRMFGGDIWAESKDGQMVFTLKFPKVEEESEADKDASWLN